MPRVGKVGALPLPAWRVMAGMLSSPEFYPDKTLCATVLSLRRTCKALADVVAAGCVGGACRLDLGTTGEAAQLEAAPTAGLGRAVVVKVELLRGEPDLELLEALARALALAVERGHMVWFRAWFHEGASAVTRVIEAALIEASREGQLLLADPGRVESSPWSLDTMAQLSVIELSGPKRETVATLVGPGNLQRATFSGVEWTDVSILSSLREATLCDCAIEDLSPLADVPLVVISNCDIKALPAMRNDVLRVILCDSLTDVSGLAGGRVGHLELQLLFGVKDVSAIGAMQPPPRTVTLWTMNMRDVSMLQGIHRLELIRCRHLDKAATLAALKDKVGTIEWRDK